MSTRVTDTVQYLPENCTLADYNCNYNGTVSSLYIANIEDFTVGSKWMSLLFFSFDVSVLLFVSIQLNTSVFGHAQMLIDHSFYTHTLGIQGNSKELPGFLLNKHGNRVQVCLMFGFYYLSISWLLCFLSCICLFCFF